MSLIPLQLSSRRERTAWNNDTLLAGSDKICGLFHSRRRCLAFNLGSLPSNGRNASKENICQRSIHALAHDPGEN